MQTMYCVLLQRYGLDTNTKYLGVKLISIHLFIALTEQTNGANKLTNSGGVIVVNEFCFEISRI